MGGPKKSDELKKRLGTFQPCRAAKPSLSKNGNSLNLKPPADLSRESRGLWRQVCAEFIMDRPALYLLRQACEAHDLLRDLQKVIEENGLLIENKRTGATQLNPAVQGIKACRETILRLWKALGISEPIGTKGE